MKLFKDALFIFVVALFFAGITASVNQALVQRISLNEQTRNARYLLDALAIDYPSEAQPRKISELADKRTQKEVGGGMTVYRGLDKEGEPVGFAFPISGDGFWGRINGLLALDPDLDTIRGIVFTSHNETPGLGARIEEPWFRDQFRGIKLSNAPTDGTYVRISSGDASGANTVDAITGATMTSNAVQRIVNTDIQKIVEARHKIRRISWPSPPEK
jgi:Na+-transporting NADH:ubiquinone oxidoreductase subunit C